MQRHPVADRRGQHHRDVKLAADQEVLEVFAGILDHVQLDQRKGAAEALEDVGEDISGDKRGDPERQPPPHLLGLVAEGHARRRHIGEDLARMAQEGRALVGDLKPPRLPVEETDAEIVLQRPDRLGHRALRDRKPPRRARDAPRLGGGDEELELTKGEGHA